MKKTTPFFIALLLLFFTNSVVSQSIIINEILTSNTSVNTDEDGTYQDWVELYNTGASAVNLSGFGLTDDATLPYKWTFPNVSLAAGQYLLVWCSDKNRTVPGNPLHTNFKISSSGEIITLTNASAVTVDAVPATVIPSNISYGRIPNGSGSFLFMQTVTPAAVNTAVGYTEILSPPTFSQNSGFSTTNISLTLSTTTPGATIYYTLDGSEPDPANLAGTTYQYKNVYAEHPGDTSGPLLSKSFQTFTYSGAINIVNRSAQANKIASNSSTYSHSPTYIPASPIFKGTVVKAKVVKAGALSSPSASKSYFVNPSGNSRFSLPVMSLSLSENQLFDYNNGIYTAGVDFDNWRAAHPTWEPVLYEDLANYYRRGLANEKVASMSYFVNGVEKINQSVGLRIHGGSSRDFPNKSMNIYARSDYGDDDMDYQFFPDRSLDVFKKFVLRNSGNDFNQTMFRDDLNQELLRSLHVTTKGYQPVITFINGEYWGLLNLNEKVDEDYFETAHNIPKDQLDLMELEGEIDPDASVGDNIHYLQMMNYAEANSLASDANYQYMLTLLDPESFMDYYISNIFLMNEDWPANNVVMWRKRTAYTPTAPYGEDGRWRWVIHDTDATYAIDTENFNTNTLAVATTDNGDNWPNPEWSTRLLRKMLQNPTFKTAFINRFADLLNTTFLSTRMLQKIADIKAMIAPEMPEVFARWKSPLDNDDWNYFIDIEKAFSAQRQAFQRTHIRNKFAINSNINATLNVDDVSHGYIKMNTIDVKTGTDGILSNPYPWTGIYFYGIPVTMKAIANPGFTFSHWTGASTSTNAEITLTPVANFSLTAVFVPAVLAPSLPVYFWMMDSSIPNDTPLTSLTTTYKAGILDGVINYQSCLVGYPFTSADPNWRTASMERRNSPTSVNYIPEANGNLAYAPTIMKGLQITEPFESGSLRNTMVFNFSTIGYEDIKFSFAALNELTNATGILVDYSVNPASDNWITTGLTTTTLPLTAAYQQFSVDFSSISAVENNAAFKIRLRFTGTNMTASAGHRITFNNIAVHARATTLAADRFESDKFVVYPNPFSDIVNVAGINETQTTSYEVFTIDGKLVRSGALDHAQLSLNDLSKGMYLLKLYSEGKSETKKIVKK